MVLHAKEGGIMREWTCLMGVCSPRRMAAVPKGPGDGRAATPRKSGEGSRQCEEIQGGGNPVI